MPDKEEDTRGLDMQSSPWRHCELIVMLSQLIGLARLVLVQTAKSYDLKTKQLELYDWSTFL
jgi:hypothetical protein